MRNQIMHTGKDKAPSYDPQVGAAASANAALADRSVQFSEDYYNKYVAPMIEQMTAASKDTQANENKMYADNQADSQQQRARYQQFGIPAEDRYYKQAADYSSADEENKQAGLAIGDVRAAQASQQTQMNQRLLSMGIDPSSPAAISAMGDSAVMGAAAQAGAANRARMAAKAMGMQLTSDAANFGRGGTSQVLAFGNAASGNTTSAFGTAAAASGAANAGATPVQNGFGLGLKGYGANLDAYAGLQKGSMAADAQSDAGFGNFLGTIGAAAMPKLSDRRIKKNILRIGETESGLPIYQFDYLWDKDGVNHIGVLAQDVLPVIPEAVSLDAAGFYRVDYNLLR